MSKSPRVSRETVRDLAQLVGIDMDDQRADTIAARLGSVLDDLDRIPDEALADLEPAPTFAADGGTSHG